MATSTEFHIPEVNLAQFMVENMSKYGSAVALVDAETGSCYTYSEVINRIQRLAAGLRGIGLGAGDVLCVLLYNNIDYPVIMYATNLLGAVLQTMSPLYKDDDITRRLCQCRPHVLVTSEDQVSRATHLVQNAKSTMSNESDLLNKIIVIGKNDNFIEYDTLFGDTKVTEPANIDPKTTAAIYLSSGGTSGPSKIVQLSHTNIAANMPQMLHVYRHRFEMCTIGFLGMFHHYGNCGVMSTCLYSGVKLVVMKQYDTMKYIDLIEKYKADILQVIPTIAIQLVKSPLRASADLSSVKFIHSAGGPLGTELMKELMTMFNRPFISQLYGLSETGLITGCYENAFKIGSSGIVTIGTELKIVNVDTREELPANVTGEILCKGPQVTIGYLNNPEATKEAFDKDGFFKTGDTGYMDEDGFLFVIDRVKDLIKYKGHQIAPAYLEDILMKHAEVIDAAVVGISDNDSGEEIPKAFIVRRQGSAVTEKHIVVYIEDQVEDYARLRGGVEFIEQIPKTPAGKRLRRLLKQYGSKACDHI